MIRRFLPQHGEALAQLFRGIETEAPHFRPHPLTADHAATIAGYPGEDVYAGAWDGETLLGYGFLRGWDEGYAIPSLGIYLRPEARGSGLAAELMAYLHRAAAAKGATTVRLRVAPDNLRARQLYVRCGYAFDGQVERGELVGLKHLDQEQ